MFEPAYVRGKEVAQIWNAVFEHGEAVDAHAEGKALIDLRVDADITQDIGVDHTAAQNLHPICALADAQFLADALIADIHFGAGFGEREKVRAKAGTHFVHFKEGFDEFFQTPFQMTHMGFGIDDQTFDLVKHRRVGLVAVTAIGPPRRDDTNGRLFLHHGADLHRACVGAEQFAAAIIAFIKKRKCRGLPAPDGLRGN